MIGSNSGDEQNSIGRNVESRSRNAFYRSSSFRPAIFIRERSNPCFSG